MRGGDAEPLPTPPQAYSALRASELGDGTLELREVSPELLRSYPRSTPEIQDSRVITPALLQPALLLWRR